MAQNLATKYSPKVVERFRAKSQTEGSFSVEYDWNGVNSINVYSIGTATMNDYTRSGQSRYGLVTEVDTTVQNLPLSRDRSFTKSIDRRNKDESQGAQEAGRFLKTQMDEVITPEIDVYRLAALSTAATANSAYVNTAATTKDTAYVDFLAANSFMTARKVPLSGRTAWMTSAFYAFLKQSGFVVASEIAMNDRKSGDLGMVDGVPVRVVPSSYLPGNTDLLIAHNSSWVSPMVLADYITHNNAPGINGWLVEGRVVYDAFVFTSRIDGIAAHKTS